MQEIFFTIKYHNSTQSLLFLSLKEKKNPYKAARERFFFKRLQANITYTATGLFLID